MWFKKKIKTTEVCGFLDFDNKFFLLKEDRDNSNNRMRYKIEEKKIISQYDDIINHLQEIKSRPFELSNLLNISNYNKLRILTLFAAFLKLKENE